MDTKTPDVDELIKIAQGSGVQSLPEDQLAVLIRVASAPEEEKVLEANEDSIIEFINKIGLEAGIRAVHNQTIYQAYLDSTEYPVGVKVFNRLLRKYFKHGKTGGIIFYYIDPTALGLAPDYTLYKDPKLFRKNKNSGKNRKKAAKKRQQKQDQE